MAIVMKPLPRQIECSGPIHVWREGSPLCDCGVRMQIAVETSIVSKCLELSTKAEVKRYRSERARAAAPAPTIPPGQDEFDRQHAKLASPGKFDAASLPLDTPVVDATSTPALPVDTSAEPLIEPAAPDGMPDGAWPYSGPGERADVE